MDASRIKAFIDAMASSDLAEMEVVHDGWTLRLVRRADPAAPRVHRQARQARQDAPRAPTGPSAAAAEAASGELHAPLFGVVHLQPSPDAPPYVSAGQPVTAGQTVAVIEAMKVFNEVTADRDGIVDALLVPSGTEVEAGQPLLRWR